MKTRSDLLSLVNQRERITMTDLRKQPGEIVACVMLGKIFELTHNGKLIALITPLPKEPEHKRHD